jgi:hypothetical protein
MSGCRYRDEEALRWHKQSYTKIWEAMPLLLASETETNEEETNIRPANRSLIRISFGFLRSILLVHRALCTCTVHCRTWRWGSDRTMETFVQKAAASWFVLLNWCGWVREARRMRLTTRYRISYIFGGKILMFRCKRQFRRNIKLDTI